MGATKVFLKGETIVEEGSFGDRTFRIRTGEVLIFKKTRNDRKIPLVKLGTGEIFGEMYLNEGDKKRTASVVAISDVEVEVIFQEELEDLLQQTPPFLRSLMEANTRRLSGLTAEYTRTAEECKQFSFMGRMK